MGKIRCCRLDLVVMSMGINININGHSDLRLSWSIRLKNTTAMRDHQARLHRERMRRPRSGWMNKKVE